MSSCEKINRLISESKAYLSSRKCNHLERNQYLRILVESISKILLSHHIPMIAVEHFKLEMHAVIPNDPTLHLFHSEKASSSSVQETLSLLNQLECCALKLSASTN